jgi:hypothetical protein
MKRTGFRRPAYNPPAPPPPRPANAPTASMQARGDAIVPMPKGEGLRPGKRAPTREEREWMDAIVELGCVACWLERQPSRPTAVHHLLEGGVRRGHMSTIALCDPGHHQNGQPLGLVSRHPWKARFEARYGEEEALLALTRQRVEARRAGLPDLPRPPLPVLVALPSPDAHP